MVDKRKVVFPENMGRTISYGKLDPNKYDVNINKAQLEIHDGAISIKQSTLDNAGAIPNNVIDFRLTKNNVLSIELTQGDIFDVDLRHIFNNSFKDIFLKDVAFKKATKEFVFTIGHKDDNAEDEELVVNASDLIPVTVGKGLLGDGTENNPISLSLGTGLKYIGNTINVDDTHINKLISSGLPTTETIKVTDAFGDTIFEKKVYIGE